MCIIRRAQLRKPCNYNSIICWYNKYLSFVDKYKEMFSLYKIHSQDKLLNAQYIYNTQNIKTIHFSFEAY